MAPGTMRGSVVFQSTLPRRQCEKPDAAVVPSSDRCTLADATAGAMPAPRRSEVVVTPYAIPRAPSIS